MKCTYIFPSVSCLCGNAPLSFEICSVLCIICKWFAPIGHYLGMTGSYWLMRIRYVRWREGRTNRLKES